MMEASASNAEEEHAAMSTADADFEPDCSYDEFMFPTIPEPPATLRGMTSRDEELKALTGVQVNKYRAPKF